MTNLTRSPVLLFFAAGRCGDRKELPRPGAFVSPRHRHHRGSPPLPGRSLCFEAGLQGRKPRSWPRSWWELWRLFTWTCGCSRSTRSPSRKRVDPPWSAFWWGRRRLVSPPGACRHRRSGPQPRQSVTPRERLVVDADLAAPGSGAVRYTEFEGEIAFDLIGGGASPSWTPSWGRAAARPTTATSGRGRMKACSRRPHQAGVEGLYRHRVCSRRPTSARWGPGPARRP